jgi:hypothetical protein
LHRLLEEMGFPLLRMMTILWQPKLYKDGEEYCFAHAHTQHIKKTCHFVHDQIKKGTIIMEYVRFKD